MLKNRTEKTKNIFEGIGSKDSDNSNAGIDINTNANDDINVDIDECADDVDSTKRESDFGKLLAGKSSEEMIMKGLYLRKDQVKSLEKYCKISKKSYSEFVRDALDIVFAEIEKAQQK